MKKLLRKGFTIVELVIVIAVIAILAAVLIPTFSGVVSKANASAALQEANGQVSNALLHSSSAQLQGTTKNSLNKDIEKTYFVINGYCFKYDNVLTAVDYPSASAPIKKGATSTNDNNFNSILMATSNILFKTSRKAATVGSQIDTTKVVSGDTFTIQNVNDEIVKYASDNETGCTDIAKINNVTYVDGHLYLNFSCEYEETEDLEISASKNYYTYDDEEDVYVVVASPNVDDIEDYFEIKSGTYTYDAEILFGYITSKNLVVFTTFGK